MRRNHVRGACRRVLGAVVATAVGASLLAWTTQSTPSPTTSEPAISASDLVPAGGNRPTPGNFTGYGFDQCEAPSQRAMNHWLARSPYLAVGIYISGESRGCRAQTNLTPQWVRTQLRKDWRLLPITLGPQASCNPHFPRYGHDQRINWRPGSHGNYGKARGQGRREATKSVRAARKLGIVKGSTLYYDLEAFNRSRKHCRESALSFLHAWTRKLHSYGYKSGVYSSAASGIKALDDARVNRPRKYAMPDQVWIADWNGKANTKSSYVRDSGWRNHSRIKQYRGGHKETWGGVTINVDTNRVDVGRGTVSGHRGHCGRVRVSFQHPWVLRPGQRNRQVLAIKCLLRERHHFKGNMDPYYGPHLRRAVGSFKKTLGWKPTPRFGGPAWTALLSKPIRMQRKVGSGGEDVRNIERTLNAIFPDANVKINGVYERETARAVRRYQKKMGLPNTGVTNFATLRKMKQGAR